MWKALEACKNRGEMVVEVVTDSRCMAEGFPKAMANWIAANFDHVPQGEIWREIARTARGMKVTLRWVKAQQTGVGVDITGNAEADKLANAGREKSLPPKLTVGAVLSHLSPEDVVPTEEEKTENTGIGDAMPQKGAGVERKNDRGRKRG